MTRVILTADERARERDPWRDLQPPPGSKEAAEAAKRLKVEQAKPKPQRRP